MCWCNTFASPHKVDVCVVRFLEFRSFVLSVPSFLNALSATTAHQPVEFFITLFQNGGWMVGGDGNDDDILKRTRDALSECATHSTTLKKQSLTFKYCNLKLTPKYKKLK